MIHIIMRVTPKPKIKVLKTACEEEKLYQHIGVGHCDIAGCELGCFRW